MDIMTSTDAAPSTPPDQPAPQSQKRTLEAPISFAMSNFGYPFEGMEADEKTPKKRLSRLRDRYKQRLSLARQDSMPEGKRFRHEIDSGAYRSPPLLSPPDMVAVKCADGTWFRRIRGVSDGPQPYSDAFYKEYLEHYELPPWFLRAGHLAMLYDNAEARILGIEVPAAFPNPRTNYLEEMYPLTVIHPPVLPQRPERYRLVGLSMVDTLYLARRFPATSVDFEHHTFVTTSGHLVLRSIKSRADDLGTDTDITSDDNLQWQYEDPSDIKASYRLEVHDRTARPSAGAQIRGRRILAKAHVNEGGLVNPTVLPAGLGRWQWFDATIDQRTARDQGYGVDFVGITKAREAGTLPSEPDSPDFPAVVWYTDKGFHNLDVQREGAGRWKFLTSEGDDTDDARAAMHFGGRHQLPHQPSARQIFELRRRFAGSAQRPAALDEVNVVWIPGTEASDSDAEEDENVVEVQVEVDGQLDDDVDESDFDPTNGEPDTDHDQTGDYKRAKYHTSRIGGKVITLDRSRIVLGERQEWKTWAYTNKGWQQYPQVARVDWDSQKSIDMVAKWRDQATRRAGWPLLRPERPVYNDVERKFVRDCVQQAFDNGEKPDIAELYHEFKKAFGNDRSEAAIAALALRIRREIAGLMASGEQDEGPDEDQDEDMEGDRMNDEQDLGQVEDQYQGEDDMMEDQAERIVGEGEKPGVGDANSVYSEQLLEGVPVENDEDSLFVT